MKTNSRMTHFFSRIGFIIMLLGFVSCKSSVSKKENDVEIPVLRQDYTNKQEYNINIGDTLKIYHSSKATACDFICAPNKETLDHLEYIEDKLVDSGQPKGCLGCRQIYALVFVAQSSGLDTIFQKKVCVDTPCSDTLAGFNEHIIIIK